ncbi:MAG: ABC transporter permease subunit [Candidatus Thermoplasmatota archaeon]|jgi:peptide/nickel transport system permease protein|nr:ABC transporter permease subunit [Candidatus Thermoplasmatota archaeon]MCL5984221.1 ABC transporter permease subunit [Candidatus Thermoplasmatota archaeon]
MGRRLDRILRNRALLLGSAILLFYVLVAVYAMIRFRGSLDYIPPHPDVIAGLLLPQRPTLTLFPFHLGAYPLGETGGLGFNVAEALVKGTPWDLAIFSSVIVPTAILGMVVGTLSGAGSGLVDDLLMAVTDVILSIPPFVFALLLFVVVLPRVPTELLLPSFLLGFILVLWAPYARLVRAEAKRVSRKYFVEAAAASGASRSRILFRHVLPNSLTPMLSQIPITLSTMVSVMTLLPFVAIFSSGSVVNFVTFLPSLDFPEWTWTLANGLLGWSVITETNSWWGYTYPIACLMFFGAGVTLFVNGLTAYLTVES